MSSIQIFQNEMFGEIRTAGTTEDPLFCAVDIARALGYSNPAKAVIDHCKGVTVLETPTAGGIQPVKFIAEPEVYRLIFKSNAPLAEKFNSWFAEEVLPSIRKTGGYMVTKVDDTPEEIMARAILVAQETIARRDKRIKELIRQGDEQQKLIDAQAAQVSALTGKVAEMQSKVSYLDVILNNPSTILVTQIAQDYGMSAKAFNKKLYEMGIQHKVGGQWILYANHIAHGYVHSKPVEIQHKDGRRMVKYNSEWTQKGRLFLYEQLKHIGIVPLIERAA